MSERADCPNVGTNRGGCTCPSSGCPNHGVCCACVEQHRRSGDLPMCLRRSGR